ncbi:hypothetical protein BGZ49_004654, partial [Haplosporangium sp. Z 27]
MSSSQSAKEKKKAIKETLKSIEQEYKSKIREAEKKCNKIREEADKEAEREKAIIKARKDKIDKEAKEELQSVKHEAQEAHVKVVMDIVKNVILDIQSKNLEKLGHFSGSSLNRSYSSSSSSSFGSAIAQEDAEIKDWVEYAAEKLENHMPKSQVRQRLLEEVAAGALIRQHQAQQEAARKTDELQRQIEELRLLQQQHLHHLPPNYLNDQSTIAAMASAPPSYVTA